MGANTSTEPPTFLRIEPDPDGDARRERQLSYEHHMAEQRRLIERLRSDPSKRELALSVRARVEPAYPTHNHCICKQRRVSCSRL